jgi:hypothetical protein
MVFWIAILVGVLFVWLAIRMGFYETWVLFFNAVISIYLSVFLTPILIEWVPAPGAAPSYHVALCMILLAGGSFAVLHGLSFIFLTSQYHIPFPRVFDSLLSGMLGFATGFLVFSFLGLVLTTTPLAENKIVGTLGLGRPSQPAKDAQTRTAAFKSPNLSCLTRCCDLIHSFAGFHDPGITSQAAVQELMDLPRISPVSRTRPTEANEPPPPKPLGDTPSRPNRRLNEQFQD